MWNKSITVLAYSSYYRLDRQIRSGPTVGRLGSAFSSIDMRPVLLLACLAIASGVRFIGRRNFLCCAVGCHSAHVLSAVPAIAAPTAVLGSEAAATVAAPRPKVAAWPGVEYLEPVYVLKLSIDALALGVSDSAKWPAIAYRLKKFFGVPLSEQYYFRGLSQQYSNAVKVCADCALQGDHDGFI